MIDIKFKRIGDHDLPLPQPQTNGAAGMDVHSSRDADIIPGEQCDVGIGFAMEIPNGYAAFLLPRSGLGRDNGIVLANTIGLIDPDFRAEIVAVLKNTSDEVFFLHKGERIGQLIVVPIAAGFIMEVDELSDTERGSGKFGSTGR